MNQSAPQLLCVVALRCVLGLAGLTTGCVATSGYVAADFTPVNVERYPHTYYDGQPVYLIGDRWYLSDGGSWFYLSVEPAPLYRYRTDWYAAHPHWRPYHHRRYRRMREFDRGVYAAPPARRRAPPARRIR
jgi:hypothetical protein